MSLAIAFLAAALAGTAPDSTTPQVEVIDVAATGVVTRPADIFTFQVDIEESGASDAEARGMALDRIRALIAAAHAAGMADADIRASSVHLASFATMTPGLREAYREQAELRRDTRQMRRGQNAPSERASPINATATAGVVFRLRDLSRLDALHHAMSLAGQPDFDLPEFALADQREADAAARRQALAMARSEAEAEAAARGLKVARISRVSERVGLQLETQLLSDLFVNRHASGGALPGPEIIVRRPLTVTFELVPR